MEVYRYRLVKDPGILDEEVFEFNMAAEDEDWLEDLVLEYITLRNQANGYNFTPKVSLGDTSWGEWRTVRESS